MSLTDNVFFSLLTVGQKQADCPTSDAHPSVQCIIYALKYRTKTFFQEYRIDYIMLGYLPLQIYTITEYIIDRCQISLNLGRANTLSTDMKDEYK